MLSRGLWPRYGNSDATWVILSFPHFAEWTSMLTYVLGFIWCCREIKTTNTCILPCPRRVNTHLPIVISPFAWLQFIFKVVHRNKFFYLLILQSPQIVVFWHIMTKKTQHTWSILLLMFLWPTTLRKHTGIVVF